MTAVESLTVLGEMLASGRRTQPERPAEAADALPLLPERYPVAGDPIPLPPPKREGLSLEAILANRMSQRAWSDEPVSLADLATVAAAGVAADRRHWFAERENHATVHLLVAARNVAGLEPGMYLYRPDLHALHLVSVEAARHPREYVLQADVSEAPTIWLVTGNLAAALRYHGDHGYRQMLQRAGAVAHTAQLAALSIGLAGCLHGGVLAPGIRRLAGINGYTEAPLFALSLGHPVRSARE